MSTIQLGQTPVEEPNLIDLLDQVAAGHDSGGMDGPPSDGDRFRLAFRDACHHDAELHDGLVNPNRVNGALRQQLGEEFNPRRFSAAWAHAMSKNGFLDLTDLPAPVDKTVSKGNGNKTVLLRRWRTDAA